MGGSNSIGYYINAAARKYVAAICGAIWHYGNFNYCAINRLNALCHIGHGNMIRSQGGLPASQSGQIIFVKRGADMQSTTDQAFAKQFAGTNYRITDIIARQKTGGASVVCAGGIYDAAGKGGNALVATAQSWVALAAAVPVVPTLAAVVGAALLSGTPILSLTTGSTAACTADIFIFGYPID